MEYKETDNVSGGYTSDTDRNPVRLSEAADVKTDLSPDACSVSSSSAHFLDKESVLEDRDSLTGIMNEMIREIVPKLDDDDNEASELIDRIGGERRETVRRPPSLFETHHKSETARPGDGTSCLRLSQSSAVPPSGPFVVGDQMDIMAEALNGKFLDASNMASSSGLLDSSPLQSPTSLEPSPFLSPLLMDKVKWFPRVSDHGPSLPMRKSLDHQASGSRSAHRQQKGRTDLSLIDRVRLINMSETTGKSQRSLAAEFHISVGSVNNILRRKREYLEAFEKTEKHPETSSKKFCQSQPAKKHTAFSELHVLLLRWMEIARMKAKPLSWPIILEKAREFAAKLNIGDFASATWLEHLKQTVDVSPPQSSLRAVSTDVDTKLLAMWQKMLPFLAQGYDAENIFCVTETALYYKCLPDKCFVGGSACRGFHLHLDTLEHRLTILLCCNALGERLKPLVISRHARPASLVGVQMSELPVVWRHQADGIMTTEIFADWLRGLDAAMGQQRRQIALFMDMAPSHLASVLLKHTSLKFFLDDSSHLLQPLNQGVVRTFKAYYRRRLMQAALAHVTPDSGHQGSQFVSDLDAIFWIQDAWRSISTETIGSSFRVAAFPHNLDSSNTDRGSPTRCILPTDLPHLVQKCGQAYHFTPMSVDTYVEFDSQVPCHHGETEDWEHSLVSEAVDQQIKTEPDDGSSENSSSCSRRSSADEEPGQVSVTVADAVDCMQKLKRFSVGDIGLLTTVYELESLILDSLSSSPPSSSHANLGLPMMPINCD